jgi:hypothetical protein
LANVRNLYLSRSLFIVISRLFALLTAFTLPAFAADSAAPAPDTTPIGSATDTPTGNSSAALRGYGQLTLSHADGKTEWTFAATSAKNATTTVAKFLADLNLSPGVTTGTIDVGGKSVGITTVPGGLVYAGYVEGSTGHVVAAKDADVLKAQLAAAPSDAATNLAYPPYLDRFDRHGWGFYGFDTNFGPAGGPDNNTDPIDDMEFLGKHNFRFELWPQPTEFDDSYSIPMDRAFGWMITEAKKHDVPVSARLYGRLPHAKEFTDAFELPRTFLEGGWYWGTLDWRVNHRQSFFNKQMRLYMARQAQDEIKLEDNHPEIESWMMPFGEIGGSDGWYDRHGDVSPSAVASWHETIQDKLHLSLAELSLMYGRGDKSFKSYDEVPIPEVATFAGLPGEIQDLEGDWYVKQEAQKGEGLTGQWWNADISSGWDKLHMPGSVFWFKYNKGNAEQPKWVIRDFDYTQTDHNETLPVYLYDFARATVNDPRNIMPVYLNGQKVGDVATWTAWDVSKLLKPGKNRLAFETEVFTGRVFLSTDKPTLYPYLGTERNKLWVDFNDWLLQAKSDTVNVALAGMRMVEPNKPIKIMAPAGNDNDRWLDTASRFGAWGHFTGEGIWAFVWYKRYGFLYGLPGTSEGAGPAGDVPDQFNLYQRVFLEGLNGHDTVFNVQNITRVPALKQWFEDHMAVLKQMGRYDIAGPQVILYRSTNQVSTMMPPSWPALAGDTHQLQSIWNWDFARGTFQEIGQSGLYVDNGGLATHKIDRYHIMIDDGNEMVTPEAIKNIGDWVRKGGTYITLPFTGRSSVTGPDSWPIQELTGCTVSKLRTPGPDAGSVTISKDQPIFKDLAGQTFPDNGIDKDWQNVEYNLLSTELKPGADCTVLATFEDGQPAIVMHKLGAGRVISLGSVFFRDVTDVKGLWISADGEEKFLRDLFNGLGQPAVNDTTDFKVVTQRYRTNNGLDDVIVMENFAGDDRTVDLHVTLDHPPAKVYQVAMNEIKEVPFTANGNVITVSQVAIPKQEVQVFYFRPYDAQEAVAHWWQYQNKLWKPTDYKKLDFSSISRGRWIDPTLDLHQGWYWTQADQSGDDWTKSGGDFATPGAKPQPWLLDVFTAVGADTTKPLFARHTFHVKPEWLTDGGFTSLKAQGQFFDFATWGTKWQLFLNGQPLKGSSDVTSMLKPGDNVVAIRLDPNADCKYLGIQGSLYLTHARPPAKVVDLLGQWTNDINGTGAPVTFPGKASAFAPSRVVDIPADWKDKYIVCYYAKGAAGAAGIIVNETATVAKRSGGDDTELDITPDLKFGEKNTLSMLHSSSDQIDPTADWDISKVELHLYLKSEYRN